MPVAEFARVNGREVTLKVRRGDERESQPGGRDVTTPDVAPKMLGHRPGRTLAPRLRTAPEAEQA